MFRTVIPSIISSSKLLIQQQAHVKQLLLTAAIGNEMELRYISSRKNSTNVFRKNKHKCLPQKQAQMSSVKTSTNVFRKKAQMSSAKTNTNLFRKNKHKCLPKNKHKCLPQKQAQISSAKTSTNIV
jgi:hypothetical protein